MDARMVELMREYVATIRARLPASRDWATFVWDPDKRELLATNAEAARAWGWLEGVADAEDVTLCELLDEAGVLHEGG